MWILEKPRHLQSLCPRPMNAFLSNLLPSGANVIAPTTRMCLQSLIWYTMAIHQHFCLRMKLLSFFFIITQSFVSIWMAVCVCWCGNPVGKFRHMQRQQYSTLRLSSLISVVSYPSKLSLEQCKMSETCITRAQTQRYSLKRDFIRGIFITLK